MISRAEVSFAWPPAVPDGWSVARHSSLFKERDERGDTDLPLLAVTIADGVLMQSDYVEQNGRKPVATGDLLTYKTARRGDLVYNKMRMWQGALGRAPVDGQVSPAYVVLAPSERVFSPFFEYLFRSAPFVVEAGRHSYGIADDQNSLRYEDFKAIHSPLPPLEEQRRIVAFLDRETARIDELVREQERLVEVILERRAAVTMAAVSGADSGEPLETADVPWLRRRAVSWRDVRVRFVAKLGTGHTPSRSRPELWEDCTIPWVTTGEVAQLRDDRIEYLHQTRENISQLGLMNSAAVLHPAGTVVLSRTASAGFSGIMAVPMATSQDFVTWTCGPELRPRFLLLCLRAMRDDLLGRLAMGSTHKTIYMPDVESLKIPLPSVEEQDLIVERTWRPLHKMDEMVDDLREQSWLLNERRSALITAAVTGQLDLTDWRPPDDAALGEVA